MAQSGNGDNYSYSEQPSDIPANTFYPVRSTAATDTLLSDVGNFYTPGYMPIDGSIPFSHYGYNNVPPINFDLGATPPSNSEQLSSEQLAAIKEYIDGLEQQNLSTHSLRLVKTFGANPTHRA